MSSSLSDLLLDRLERDTKPQEDWPELVLAALQGEAAVDALLRTAPSAKPQPAQAKAQDRAGKASPTAYLRSITVEGFRGIGRPATLDLVPGPGLTLVIGRNSSGLSPGDRPRHVLDKVGRLVWVIDPRKAKAVVYRSLSDARELGPQDALDGEDVLPGFSCPLQDIL